MLETVPATNVPDSHDNHDVLQYDNRDLEM